MVLSLCFCVQCDVVVSCCITTRGMGVVTLVKLYDVILRLLLCLCVTVQRSVVFS